MGKLKQLKPALTSLPSVVRYGGTEADVDRARDATQPWRAWYKTSRWRKLRLVIFRRDLFTCQECGRLQGDTSQLVADHKQPHFGSEAKFWNPDNLQTLCKSPCHDQKKQREDAAVRRQGGAFET